MSSRLSFKNLTHEHALDRRTLLGSAGAAIGGAALANHASAATPVAEAPPSEAAEVLWDTWGVPHIVAGTASDLFYAFGWAQTHNHGDILLKLYAQARGRASEYFGPEALEIDHLVRTMGINHRGEDWYLAQSQDFKTNLDSFAAGINAYATAYPDRLEERGRAVLPITAEDILCHTARIVFQFLGNESEIFDVLQGRHPGSNAWAVAPDRTANGLALLLTDPHLPWGGEFSLFEAHLSIPDVYEAYGVTIVGIPVLAMAFNDHHGWSHTSNALDAADIYLLTSSGDGYLYDGELLPFESQTEGLRILQEDGAIREEELTIRRSVHGPVMGEGENLFAIRITGIDTWSTCAGILEQWWDMARTTTLAEFEDVLRRLQLPYFTVIYADRDGHIMSVFNGQVPVRPDANLDWSEPIAGDTSATLWTAIHPYEDLPKVTDPPSGWVQNSNSPPWYTTHPRTLDPADFPPYMSTKELSWRERRGIRMLTENPEMTLEQLVALKYSTRFELADRVLDDLIAAARSSGDATAIDAADVLAAWDRSARPESTGVLLFVFWTENYGFENPGRASSLFATPEDLAEPLATPGGLGDPELAVRALIAAANDVQTAFGRLDVPWGEAARMQAGDYDEPANGFSGNPFGVFHVLEVDQGQLHAGAPAVVDFGETYIATIEFGDVARARVLLTYGNSSQPGSPHVGDQLTLATKGELRPAWRTREEIEAHLEAREVLTTG